MLLPFIVLLPFLVIILTSPIIANGCFEVERDALLTFKAGLHDPGNLLITWHGPNCCTWSGVICDNITEHVVMLNLRNPYDLFYGDDDWDLDDINGYSNWESHAFTGEIDPSLLSLRHLTHLDLSNHFFWNNSFPNFICSLENLVYLNLSFSSFGGLIPHELENLSRLQFLDLGGSSFTGLIPPQLGNLSDLHHLSLSAIDIYHPFPVLASDNLS
ncbi:LRR receptor-like serine/threonine-protein kinase GSO1 [Rhynchospora pubera]|uniref:LRR receptor-like serine/threonine-protein kinase GSO1 n=1 Tax=Rhynchospora pubera TaxID=906938 RepID=A0AAV8GQF1_9POAL|nr:LRR receptor-like serine/threonine-protein kinase GSO1 [Rhynchospora pubera]